MITNIIKPRTAVTATAGSQVQPPVELGKLNPFSVADDVISKNIIGIHDSQATRHDVSPLYNVVTNIVKSSTHIDGSLDLKVSNVNYPHLKSYFIYYFSLKGNIIST